VNKKGCPTLITARFVQFAEVFYRL